MAVGSDTVERHGPDWPGRDPFDPLIERVHVEADAHPDEGYRTVRLETKRGDVVCRYYAAAPDVERAAVWVGGVGGDFDTPAQGLYPRLCRELTAEGIASLRVRFRYPTILEEAVYDLLAGVRHLEREGVLGPVALIGHSFGGAAVIQAAARAPAVRAVVTLATQSYGADPVSRLAPRCAVLLIHGTADEVLPPSSSEHLYRLAGEPKAIRLHKGAGHGLDEAAPEVEREVREWIAAWLREPSAP